MALHGPAGSSRSIRSDRIICPFRNTTRNNSEHPTEEWPWATHSTQDSNDRMNARMDAICVDQVESIRLHGVGRHEIAPGRSADRCQPERSTDIPGEHESCEPAASRALVVEEDDWFRCLHVSAAATTPPGRSCLMRQGSSGTRRTFSGCGPCCTSALRCPCRRTTGRRGR